MFFIPGDHGRHGLRHNPFKAIVAPRPIAWISTIDAEGRSNLAPFSFFNAVAEDPPCVVLGISGTRKRPDQLKDTAHNLRQVPEFVVNFASWRMREAVHQSGGDFPRGTDEFAALGLETAPSEIVRPPRIAASPAHLECIVAEIVALPPLADGRPSHLVLGRVVGLHVAESAVREGRFDLALAQPLARLGYRDYGALGEVVELD